MEKENNYDGLILETDGKFFDNMRQMERRVLTKYNDIEALAILDEEERIAEEEYEEELRQERNSVELKQNKDGTIDGITTMGDLIHKDSISSEGAKIAMLKEKYEEKYRSLSCGNEEIRNDKS